MPLSTRRCNCFVLVTYLALGAPATIGQAPPPATLPPDPAPVGRVEPLPSVAPPPNAPIGGAWQAQGPGPATDGQVENVQEQGSGVVDDQVVGAIHTVAAHPTNANVLYAGATNGGIWKTTNAQAASPAWTPLTDSGATWTQLNPSGVMSGATIVAASNRFFGNQGVFRSANTGASFSNICGTGSLPASCAAFDLVGDPNTLTKIYAAVFDNGAAFRATIHRSDDIGATWTNITTGPLDTALAAGGSAVNNIEIAVSPVTGRLYAAVLRNGQVSFIGYTDNPMDASPTWVAMDLPLTQESNGDTEGLNPREKPGSQGGIHFSIRADPTSANIIYVGGDRQDLPFPNFIGAVDYSGRLFRGDTTIAPTGGVPSPQWDHLTHSDSIVAIPGGGAANSSSPHADSREMVFDANGNLVEVDDGGIYRRTSPAANTGDWFSINGDIQTTEMHDVAYDTNSNVILSGNQDTGTTFQSVPDNATWFSKSTADGGDVAVDTITLVGSNQSIRYSSFQNLGGFRRSTWDASNSQVGFDTFPDLTLSGPGENLSTQFVTPVELNAVDPTRIIIGGSNGPYESTDQGETIVDLNGPGVTDGVNGFSGDLIAYGGFQSGIPNEDVLYVGSGSDVLIRTASGGSLTASGTYPGTGFVRDIVLDPSDWAKAFVIDSSNVFMTVDAGATWSNITGDLVTEGLTDFRALEYAEGADDCLFVAGLGGVFATFESDGFTDYAKFGSDLANAPVYDLDYDPADDVLVAGTMGRGAWKIANIKGCSPDGFEPDGTSGQASLLSPGVTQNHNICPAGDEDWATFTLTQESQITLTTSGPAGWEGMTVT